MVIAAEMIISGKVQGVGYRYFTVKQADRFGLTGFVKNLPDGRVFVFAEGEKEIIQQFKTDLEKGPRFSRVENVEINFSEYKSKYKKFLVDY